MTLLVLILLCSVAVGKRETSCTAQEVGGAHNACSQGVWRGKIWRDPEASLHHEKVDSSM